jgi:hypothetical protein
MAVCLGIISKSANKKLLQPFIILHPRLEHCFGNFDPLATQTVPDIVKGARFAV